MSFTRWNDITTMKFINLYQGEECLWNARLLDYKNKDARNLALERIAAAMDLEGFGVSDVKYKIKNIRSSYCQELKKIQFSQASCSSPEDVYKPTVVWFGTLHSFLKNFVFQRERPPNYQQMASSRKRSEIWFHFLEIPNVRNKASCNYCQKPVSFVGGSTGNLSRHLKTMHPAVPINRSSSSYFGERFSRRGASSIKDEEVVLEDMTQLYDTDEAWTPVEEDASEKQDAVEMQLQEVATAESARQQFKRFRPSDSDPVCKAIDRLKDVLDKKEEDNEFEAFGRSVACQLKRLSVRRAASAQMKIQTILSEERIDQELEQQPTNVP